MLTFLFWNLGGAGDIKTRLGNRAERRDRLARAVVTLAERHGVDMLMLAECPIPPEQMILELNRGNPVARQTGFRKPDPRSLCEKLLVIPRFPTRFLLLRTEAPRYTCRQICLPGGRPEILLFVVHFGSKMHRSEASQALALPGFSETIRQEEKKRGCSRTIVVGDFNMNPFEDGIVGAEKLNAAMTHNVALQGERIVDRKRYPSFYNPMRGHFGDSKQETAPPRHADHEPSGTCFYPAKESRWHYWNMFDQVLFRPELLPVFRNSDLKILTGDHSIWFVDEHGIPDRRAFSDHLPILFRLNI